MCVKWRSGRAHAAHHCGNSCCQACYSEWEWGTDSPLTLEEISSKRLNFCLVHELQTQSSWKWDSQATVADLCVPREQLWTFLCCFSRIWHICGPSRRISQRQARLRRGETCEGTGKLVWCRTIRIGAATAESHGVLAHADARLDRHLWGGESSEWHGADRPRRQVPGGVRLQPHRGLEGFVLPARHLSARRQLQGGFLCSPEQQPRAVGDEQQNQNNLLRPGGLRHSLWTAQTQKVSKF